MCPERVSKNLQHLLTRARGVAGLTRLPVTEEVAGSNPVGPANIDLIFFMSAPTELSKLSKRVFGRSHRLDVWSRVLDFTTEPPETFRSHELQEELHLRGIGRNTTHQEIHILQELGMITLAPEQVHGSVYYMRSDSPGWDMVSAAVRMATGTSGEEAEA